jgi:hypothetical protein
VSTGKLYPRQMEMWWAEGKGHICLLVLMLLEMETCNHCSCFIHSLCSEMSIKCFFLLTKLSKLLNGSYLTLCLLTWDR